MSQRIAYLEAVIGADITNFRRSMREVRSEVGVLSDTIDGIGHIGRNMTLAVTAPLVAMGTAAVSMASSFDASMRNVNSILGASEDSLAALSARTLEFGATIRSGPTAASEALYTVISAGVLDTAKAFAIMEASVATAEAGVADLQITTQALTSAMLAYGAGAEQAGHFSDVITRTVQVGVGEMGAFATAIGRNVSAARAAGISFDEFGASLAYLTQRGIRVDTASTALSSALRSLINPGEELSALFTELGVSSGTELIQTFGGLEGSLLALYEAADQDIPLLGSMFTQQGTRAVTAMLNDIPALSRTFDEFYEATDGATSRAREQQLMSFAAQIDLLNSAVQALGIQVGSILMPIITPFIQHLTNAVGAIRQLPPQVLELGVAFGIAVAAAGPLLWLLSSLLSPVGLLIGAISLLAGAFANDFAGIRTTVDEVVAAIDGAFTSLTTTAEESVGATLDDIAAIIGGVQQEVSIDIPLSAQMTLWDVYYEDSEIGRQLRQMFDYDGFLQDAMTQLGVSDPRLIQVGDSLHFDMPLEMGFDLVASTLPTPGSSLSGAQLARMLMPADDPSVAVDMGLGERLKIALDAAWGVVQPKLGEIATNIIAGIRDTLLPGIDEIGSNIINWIAGGFANSSNQLGNTSFYKIFTSLLQGNFESAINAVIPGLGTALSTALGSMFPEGVGGAFPQLSAAITTLLNNAGKWLIDEGVPTISRAMGYVIGTAGSLMADFIRDLPRILSSSGGDGEGIGTAFQDSVGQPFVEGVQDAITNAGGDLDVGDTIATVVAGVIATALAAQLAGALITHGVGGLVMGAIGKAITAAAGSTVLASAGAAIAGALGTALMVALPIVLVAAYVLSPEARSAIDDLGEAIADLLFGEGFMDAARRGLEDILTPILDPLMRQTIDLQIRLSMANGTLTNEQGELQLQNLWGQGQNGLVEVGMILSGNGVGAALIDAAQAEINASGEYIQAPLQLGALDYVSQDPSEFGAGFTGMPAPFDAPVAASSAAAEFNTLLAEQIATGMVNQDFSASVEPFTNGFIGPVESGFTSSFGEGGPIVTSWRTFQTNWNNGVFDMIATGGQMEKTVPQQFQRMATQSVPKIQTVIGKMNELITAVRTLMGLGASINITAQVAGPSGARAIGGPVFAGNQYLVGENGPEIFTSPTSGMILPNSALRDNGGGGGDNYYTNEIAFYEVSDVDGIIYELERRGISLA